MSDTHASHDTHAAPVSTEPQFIPEELIEFKADDTEAGKNIGRMLVAFFFCLLFLVIFVNLFTNDWVASRSSTLNTPLVDSHHDDSDEH